MKIFNWISELNIFNFMFFLYNIFNFMFFYMISTIFIILIPTENFFNFFFSFFYFLSICLNFSFYNFFFFLSLLIIFFSVFIFSFYYQTFSFDFIRFSFLVFLFVSSMIFLIFHNNLFSLILGWDGLGATSYLLVAYYNNWMSKNGAMITMLTNRFGDFCLFWFSIYFLFFSLNSMILKMKIILFIFLFSSFTKSAQIPFNTWLPLAMSAPTPVSALVHSSTLVTAGIFIILKYFFLLKFFLFFLSLFGITTMFFASLSGIFETDGKKIIALSTLSQLGFMIFSLGCNLPFNCFFHLLSHAFFKSCLFIQMGNFIHLNFSNQDLRNFKPNILQNKFTSFCLTICLFSLSGFLFLSGFYSKEIIILMNMSMSLNFIFLILLCFSISFTMMYSFRILYSLFSNNFIPLKIKNLSTKNLMSSFFLILFSIFFSWIFFMNFSYIPLEMNLMEKLLPFFLFVFSCFLFFYSFNFSSKILLNSLFLQDKMTNLTNFFILKEKNMIENLINLNTSNLILMFFSFFKMFNSFKNHLLLFFIFILFFIIFI